MSDHVPYPGVRITTNGNLLVSYHTEARITDGGVFYPITPSTEMGENYQLAFAEGKLNVLGQSKIAIEAEGEHAAQGGAIALSVCGKRVVNFTSGQGLVYGIEQYYHAPGKLSTMIVEVSARALTKHALNVHCGHDDIYAVLDTGWIMLIAKDAQQAADHALILRRVTELALTPGINIQDGFLTSHLERTFMKCESDLIREFLGAPDDIIDCPTPAQCTLFGATRRRVPRVIDLEHPMCIGPVQNQEHYMNGVVARRNNFAEPIAGFLDDAYEEFAHLTGRRYSSVMPYRTDDAEIVFVSIGSAAENIEAAVDHLRATRAAKVGSIHISVLRPFPEKAVVEALRGKQATIILERTDEPLAGDNPLARDVRTALSRSCAHAEFPHRRGLSVLTHAQMPRIFTGVYGLGSRDFRPEHIIGAYEYAAEGRARQDGRTAADGVTHFNLGVDHPYAVVSDETPSLLPDGSIAVRLHSIGGWGMITTGKNLSEIIGNFGDAIAKRDHAVDARGRTAEVLHISANPKYGSEKKGAPTSYFLVVSPERVRVNCDLHHVNVVLCCDPKIFLHTNPLDGLAEGGAFVWESEETPEEAWQRIPRRFRQQILDKKIRLFTLSGFRIAHEATDRSDLQLRMQGNAFLGAFFRVSSFLTDYKIDQVHFRQVVHDQYVKKFSRLGREVVESNMQVMVKGFERTQPLGYGPIDAPDRSTMRGTPLVPVGIDGPSKITKNGSSSPRAPWQQLETFDCEFRAGLGYHQPASPLASIGVMAAATGATASKYVARRQTPEFIPENCTQCMECIAVCPDTAMPNSAQDVATILQSAIAGYVTDPSDRETLLSSLPELETRVRLQMTENIAAAKTAKKAGTEHAPQRFVEIVNEALRQLNGVSDAARKELHEIIDILPVAYNKVNAIFASREKKSPGSGGVFLIGIADLCKGCGECVAACGRHNALRMVPDGEELNTSYASVNAYMDRLPETPSDYLGLYDPAHPENSIPAALRNHLMVRSNYEALVSGDGACAGCGEKSVLRAVATVTEAFMRPIFTAKSKRLFAKADRIESDGPAALSALAAEHPGDYKRYRRAVAHLLMGLGGESDADTDARLNKHGSITDDDMLDAVARVMRQDARNHEQPTIVNGQLTNGMSVMAMGAHTGCNTVYGSTPPNNPHPYPWMNSLFQDGATISWIMGESFIQDHARRSVVPERLADVLLDAKQVAFGENDMFALTHLNDAEMTGREVLELPKVWGIGGDGGMGDIGFQNVSKVVLQNRPNVKILMLDTQVYSNTGGQNSDSSPLPGGFDMNQFGPATEGKLTEKKNVAEIFTVGHGSPFVAQVSQANAAKLYKCVLDALEYRGTAFVQCFTTCQPEHGVGDDVAFIQAKRVRDSRGMPEFVFNPAAGESYAEAMNLKGNPTLSEDWWTARYTTTKEPYRYTVAHWAFTEARFRRHFKSIGDEQAREMEHLDDALIRITQDDVVRRRYQNPNHRSFLPDFGIYMRAERDDGAIKTVALSRQMVLFCVERRKAWRLLQSRSGVVNADYQTQRDLLKKVDAGEIEVVEFRENARTWLDQEREEQVETKTKSAVRA